MTMTCHYFYARRIGDGATTDRPADAPATMADPAIMAVATAPVTMVTAMAPA